MSWLKVLGHTVLNIRDVGISRRSRTPTLIESYGKASRQKGICPLDADRLSKFSSPGVSPRARATRCAATVEPPSVTGFIENDLRCGASIARR